MKKHSHHQQLSSLSSFVSTISVITLIMFMFASKSAVSSFTPALASFLCSSRSISSGITTSTLHVLTPPSRSKRSSSFGDIIRSSSSSSSSSQRMEPKTIQPLIICGPSGVGKGTIISRYMNLYHGSYTFGFTVSHTTRQPRNGEVHGEHYHFTTIPEIEKSIDNHEFLEYAHVHGNVYGTSIASLLELDQRGKIPLLDIDVQGVKNIKKTQKLQQQQQQRILSDDSDGQQQTQPILKAKFIFIAPPSLESLLKRLKSRGTETQESIQKRTKNAINEMRYGMEDGNFDAIIVNDDLDQATLEFRNVIDELYDL